MEEKNLKEKESNRYIKDKANNRYKLVKSDRKANWSRFILSCLLVMFVVLAVIFVVRSCDNGSKDEEPSLQFIEMSNAIESLDGQTYKATTMEELQIIRKTLNEMNVKQYGEKDRMNKHEEQIIKKMIETLLSVIEEKERNLQEKKEPEPEPLPNPPTIVKKEYKLQIQKPQNGNLSLSENGSVESGKKIIVSAEPNADYKLERLYYIANGKQNNIDKRSKMFNMPDGDTKVYATFKKMKENQEQLISNGGIQSTRNSYPFKIYNIDVANTYYGGSIQTDYGKPIYSSNTLYLKPRVNIECFENGSVELDTKLYWPNGNLVTTQGGNGKHKPGYTTSTTINMNKGVQTINMRSWGGSDYQGNWMAGDYKCKIYYNGELVHEQIIHILEP